MQLSPLTAISPIDGRYRFVIVIDSLGVGQMPDGPKFGDIGVNTLGHISEAVDHFEIPNLQKLGIANLTPLNPALPLLF